MGSSSEHRVSTQVMNICIVFNSFSIVLLQQIQRVLHFTLDNESFCTESWRSTKIVRGPRAHVLWRDTDKLGLFSLVKRRTRGTLILLTNVWRAKKDTRTKLFLVVSVDIARNSGHKLQLGALCPYTQILSLTCQLPENRNLFFPFSAVLSLYTIQKNTFRTQRNAALQCLLIKMRAHVDTKKFFFLWRASLYDHWLSQRTVRLLCNSHLQMYCAIITGLTFARDLSTCSQMLGGNASFPCFGLLNIKIKCTRLVRSFLQIRSSLGFSETKS